MSGDGPQGLLPGLPGAERRARANETRPEFRAVPVHSGPARTGMPRFVGISTMRAPESRVDVTENPISCLRFCRLPVRFYFSMESDFTELPVHDRLLAWFETHKREVLWGAIVVSVAGLGAGFFVWHQSDRQARANQALSQIMSRGSANGAQRESPEVLLGVASDYPNTDAGGRALLLSGAASCTEGKYAEAKARFEKFLREYHDSPFAAQALLGVAVSLDAEGKVPEAIAAYNDIAQHYSSDNVMPQARLAVGRLYEKQGNLEQARDAYLELARVNSFGSISSEAGMRLQGLIARNPNLAPSSRQASTNRPVINFPKP